MDRLLDIFERLFRLTHIFQDLRPQEIGIRKILLERDRFRKVGNSAELVACRPFGFGHLVKGDVILGFSLYDVLTIVDNLFVAVEHEQELDSCESGSRVVWI